MFVTARTVCAATDVKSGPDIDRVGEAWRDTAAGCSLAGRATTLSRSATRPDRTRPKTSPVARSSRDRESRLTIARPKLGLRHLHPAGTGLGRFGDGDSENPVGEVGRDVSGVYQRREGERPGELAVPALHLVVMLAGDPCLATALQRQAAVVDVDPDLVAGEAREF